MTFVSSAHSKFITIFIDFHNRSTSGMYPYGSVVLATGSRVNDIKNQRACTQ